MSDVEESDHENDSPGPAPQKQITMLFSKCDFEKKVALDTENLCCVVVTSTICTHSGIRALAYPSTLDGVLKQPQGRSANEEFSDDDMHENDIDNASLSGQNDEKDEQSNDAVSAALRNMPKLSSLGNSRFFDEICKRLVKDRATKSQRRHVRFFHICACCEDEANIRPLVFDAYGTPDSDAKERALTKASTAGVASYGARDEAELSKLRVKAYANLVELLHTLRVRSTPTMLFFVQGQPLRYSHMLQKLPSAIRSHLTGKNDNLVATGCNYTKWLRIFRNAVVVRNALMEKYDAEAREKRYEERRLAREQKRAMGRERRRQARSGRNDDDDEDTDDKEAYDD